MKIPKNKCKEDIPITLLGRLTVDKSFSGQGFGKYLLMHALENSLVTSEKAIASIAVIVDPIDNDAITFYKKYGFILLPESKKMFLPMKTIKTLLIHFPTKNHLQI